MDIIIVLIVLQIVVVVHEAGHLVVARWYHIGVTALSVGFGPAIIRVQHRGITWKLGAIPLGGYLRVSPERPAEATNLPRSDDRSLAECSGRERAYFHLGGVAANAVTATVAGTIALALAPPGVAATGTLPLLRMVVGDRTLPLSWTEAFLVTACADLVVLLVAPIVVLWVIISLRAFTDGIGHGNVGAVVDLGSSALGSGALGCLDLLHFLSIAIAAMNLAPIFPLDGGKIAHDALQRIRRPTLRAWCTTAFTTGGPAVVLCMLLAGLIGDIRWLFR